MCNEERNLKINVLLTITLFHTHYIIDTLTKEKDESKYKKIFLNEICYNSTCTILFSRTNLTGVIFSSSSKMFSIVVCFVVSV